MLVCCRWRVISVSHHLPCCVRHAHPAAHLGWTAQLDLHTESPEIAESLDALSTFYGRRDTGPDAGTDVSTRGEAAVGAGGAWGVVDGTGIGRGNTLAARKSLRADLEAQGLRLARSFVDQFAELEEAFGEVAQHVDEVATGCEKLQSRLSRTEARTTAFLQAADDMKEERARLAARAERVENFLEQFELSPAQRAAIHSDPVDADDGDAFFAALAKVQLIRSRCTALLSASSQSVGMDILDAMAEHQEVAYERLFAWVERWCVQQEGRDPDADAAGAAFLRSALAVLRERSVYFVQAQRAVASLRRRALVDRFMSALTVGGPHGVPRPIDLHAADPHRYVGDMLAWLHVAFATEREALQGSFGRAEAGRAEAEQDARRNGAAGGAAETKGGDAGAGEGGAGGDGAEDAKSGSDVMADTLALVFDGVARPLRQRIEGVLRGVTQLVLAYRLADLLAFYATTFAQLLGQSAGLVVTIGKARDAAFARVTALLDAQAEKLVSFPSGYPSGLGVLRPVAEAVVRLREMISVDEDSLLEVGAKAALPLQVGEVLAKTLDPLLTSCRLSAEGLDAIDLGVFMINNVAAMREGLDGHAAAEEWVARLDSESQRWVQGVSAEQARYLLSQCGLTPVLRTVTGHDTAAAGPLADRLSVDALTAALKSFFGVVFSLSLPAFDRVQDGRVRNKLRRGTAQLLHAAYASVHAAVTAPENGYPEAGREIAIHSPEQIRTLLDLD